MPWGESTWDLPKRGVEREGALRGLARQSSECRYPVPPLVPFRDPWGSCRCRGMMEVEVRREVRGSVICALHWFTEALFVAACESIVSSQFTPGVLLPCSHGVSSNVFLCLSVFLLMALDLVLCASRATVPLSIVKGTRVAKYNPKHTIGEGTGQPGARRCPAPRNPRVRDRAGQLGFPSLPARADRAVRVALGLTHF